jgi:hypothetical protein
MIYPIGLNIFTHTEGGNFWEGSRVCLLCPHYQKEYCVSTPSKELGQTHCRLLLLQRGSLLKGLALEGLRLAGPPR